MAREGGFTLVEMLVVLVVMATLSAVALGFNVSARESAADASAKSNLAVAEVAVDAYGLDTGGYAGMTIGGLQATYGPGVANVTVVSAGRTTYCLSSTVEGRTWYKPGPAGALTTAPCS